MFPLAFFPAVVLVLSTRVIADPEWGTFRPQSLISARATTPHSPYFGFAYHPANSLAIRHLVSENNDKIDLVSWSRHDGKTFGDQVIRDTDANMLLKTVFLNHPTQESACVIRVSAQPLDPSKPVTPVSMILYAVAAPEERDLPDEKTSVNERQEKPWGTLTVQDAFSISEQGVDGDVRIKGSAENIGGKYEILVRQPQYGNVAPSAFTSSSSNDMNLSIGSRSRIRTRSDKTLQIFESLSNFHISSSIADPESAWAIEKILPRMLKKRAISVKDAQNLYLLDGLISERSPGVFVQRLLKAPFEIDSTFVLSEKRDLSTIKKIENDLTNDLSTHLDERRRSFDSKFNRIFKLSEKGVQTEEEEFARSALSNVLGGIGYFFGKTLVKNDGNADSSSIRVTEMPPVGLLTATPSRGAFPRGFLWDEGFHQLLVAHWDSELSQRCLLSWMKASHQSGWIPREQILGIESRNRFPQHIEHLIFQYPELANPPTILIPLRLLAKQLAEAKENKTEDKQQHNHIMDSCPTHASEDFSESLLPFSARYVSWLKRTQSGHMENSFRWRGRSEDTNTQDGYALTLASGLDDYPRASMPSSAETHVDLHSWVTWANGVLLDLSLISGKNASKYSAEYEKLKTSLIETHGKGRNGMDGTEDHLLCDRDGDDKVCRIGYPTILPLLLGILDPSDKRVKAILDAIEDPLVLRSRSGIRSLSKQDDMYRKGNDYWTGSVWMPFNYMTLAALRTKYSVEEGPYRKRAEKCFNDLKRSILENAFRVYKKTGQLWENYSPEEDGAGKSNRQFTGWSALVVLLYADLFDGIVKYG